MRALLSCGTALLLGWAPPAVAQDAEFSVGATRYTVPAPEGYCSSGPAVEAYRAAQHDGNPGKISDAVLARCGAAPFEPYDFYVVMVIREAPRITLPEIQDQLRAALPEAMKQESLVSDATRTNFEQNWRDSIDRDVKVNTGIHPVGVDDFCGYTAGIFHYEVAGEPAQDIMMTGCITSIGERPVYIFHYTSGTDTAAAVATLPRLKRFAQSIRTQE